MRVRVLSLFAILFFTSLPLFSATQNAVVYGTVYDASGNPLPNVTVTLENPTLGFARTTTTGSDGSYNFAEVPPAEGYRLVASRGDRKLDIRSGIVVNVGDERVIFPPLKEQAVAAAAAVVERKVEAQAVQNEIVSPSVSAVMTGDQLRSLPLYNRNFLVLGGLTPNVHDLEAGNPLAGASFSVAGQRGTSNNFLLDGSDNVASGSNQSVPFQVNDSIQEFRLTSSGATAEYGRNMGGVVNVLTRRGGNQFHGSVFGYFANEALNSDNPLSVYNGSGFDRNARWAGSPTDLPSSFATSYASYVNMAAAMSYCTNSITVGAGATGTYACNAPTGMTPRGERAYFDPATTLAANNRFSQPWDSKQFGISMGGPLIKDKFFLFGSYEGTRIDNPTPVFERVPTTFDNTLNPYGAAGFLFTSASPDYQLAHNVLSLYPAPNVVAVPGVFEFVQGTAPNYTNVHNFLVRSDIVKSDKTSLNFRYALQVLNQLHDDTLPATANYPGNGAFRDVKNHSLFGSYTRTLNPSLINEFRAGFTRFGLEETAQDHGLNATTLGLPFAAMPTILLNGIDAQYSGMIPNHTGEYSLWVDCCNAYPNLDYRFPYARLGAPLGAPYTRRDTTIAFSDTLSYTTGKHGFKFGVEYRRLLNYFNDASYSRGLGYSSNLGNFTVESEDVNQGHPGNAFRVPSFDFVQYQDPYIASLTSNAISLFVQDTWRIHPRFTLSLGMRYDLFTVPKEDHNFLWNYDPAANGLVQVNHTSVMDPYGNACGTALSGYPAVPQVLQSGLFWGTPGTWNCSSAATARPISADTNNFAPRLGMAWDLFGDGKTVLRGSFGWYYDESPANQVAQLMYNRPTTSPNALYGRLFSPGGTIPASVCPYAYQCGLGNTVVNNQSVLSPDGVNDWSYYSAATQPFAVYARDLGHSATPYSRQQSITIQQSLSSKLAIEFGYVGAASENLPVIYNSNFVNEWQLTPGVFSIRQFSDMFSYGPTFTMTNRGSADYHSLLARLRVADFHGFRMNATYNWGKSTDNIASSVYPMLPITGPNMLMGYTYYTAGTQILNCLYYSFGFCPTGVSPMTPDINFNPPPVTTTGAGTVLTSPYLMPQNPLTFLHDDFGNSDFDVRHRLALDYTWDIPGPRQSKLLGLWSVSGTLVAQSGQPFTIFAGPILGEVTQRVNVSGPVTITNNPSAAISLTNLSLALNNPVCQSGGLGFGTAYRYVTTAGDPCTGNSSRNAFYGPNYINTNLAVQKGFQVGGESRRLTLRAEFFNLFNRANYYNPISTLSLDGVTINPDFGKIKSAHDPRTMQFAVRFTW